MKIHSLCRWDGAGGVIGGAKKGLGMYGISLHCWIIKYDVEWRISRIVQVQPVQLTVNELLWSSFFDNCIDCNCTLSVCTHQIDHNHNIDLCMMTFFRCSSVRKFVQWLILMFECMQHTCTHAVQRLWEMLYYIYFIISNTEPHPGSILRIRLAQYSVHQILQIAQPMISYCDKLMLHWLNAIEKYYCAVGSSNRRHHHLLLRPILRYILDWSLEFNC